MNANFTQSPKLHEMTNWDERFFNMCTLLSTWSEDPHRKVGALMVGSANQIVATGYNGFPRGVIAMDERLDRTDREKFHWVEHAERNCIYNAASSGVATAGLTFYTSVFPCSDCARAIIQSGIKTLKSIQPPKNDISFKRGFEVAEIMLLEAGVELKLYKEIE